MKLSRRAVLRGAGGVALGLPLHEAMGSKAFAQTMSTKRFVLVSVGHSVDINKSSDSWLPKAASFAALSPVLAPLVPLQDKLLVLSGIDNVLSNGDLVPSNGHNYSSRSLLTCMPTKAALDGAGNLLPNRPECTPSSAAAGPSFEYVLANAWKDSVLNLRVGERPDEHIRSFQMDGTADLGIASPQAAFDKVFKASAMATAPAGAALSPADRLRAKRKSILDAVQSSFTRTVSKMGTDDRMRLERHADQIRQFELGLDKTVKITCTNPKLNPPKPLPAQLEQSEGRSDDAIAAAQVELIATAFACGASRVAHLHFTNIQTNTFAFLNGGQDFISGGWHNVVHIDAGTDEMRLRSMQFYSKVFADLITRLQQTPEGTGSVFDNTVVMFISSLRQNYHGVTDLPVLIAGNLGGKIKTGRLIKYTPARTTADLYSTLLTLLDVPTTSFGWNKGTVNGRAFNNGPLPSWA
jgi:hypothetical protein